MTYSNIVKKSCMAGDGCTNASHNNGGCGFCQSRGLPILPVRYAVTALPSVINQAPTPEYYKKIDFKNHKYILRLMRSGYLYLYDEYHSRLAGWFITRDSKFYQFPLGMTDENGLPKLISNIRKDEKGASFFSCTTSDSHYISASVIRWDVRHSKNIWLMYSELPIPYKLLTELSQDSEWRAKNMQFIDVKAWVSGNTKQQNAFLPSQAISVLSEVNYSQGTTYDCYSFCADKVLGTGKQLESNLTKYFSDYYKSSGAPGVVLGVRDDVGIIENLNHDRLLPEAEYNNAIGNPGNDKTLYKSKDYEMQRKLQCYSLLNLVKDKKIEEKQDELKEYNDDYSTAEGRRKIYSNELIKYCDPSACIDNSWLYSDESIKKLILTPDAKKKEIQTELQNKYKDIDENFYRYVDVDKYKEFEKFYEKVASHRSDMISVMDADYSIFAGYILPELCDKYSWSQQNANSAVFFIPIFFRCISGNIMSEHSKILWEKYILPTDMNGLLPRILSLHDPEIEKLLIKAFTPDETSLLDKIVTSKNFAKLTKEVVTFFNKYSKEVEKEGLWALIKKEVSKESRKKVSMAFSTRLHNIRNRLQGMPAEHAVVLSLPAKYGLPYLVELPDEISSSVKSINPQMDKSTTIKNEDGSISYNSNKPKISLSGDYKNETIEIHMVLDDENLKLLKDMQHNVASDEVFSAKISGTNEKFSIFPKDAKKLKANFTNLLKKEFYTQPGRSLIGFAGAILSFWTALDKTDKKISDYISVASGFLGVIKAGATLADDLRKMNIDVSDVKFLKLYSEIPWIKSVGLASNMLMVVYTLFEWSEAFRKTEMGEPGYVQVAGYVGAVLLSVGTILSFIPLSFGLGLVVGIVLIILSGIVAWWGIQELTLPQRLWFFRCIFGKPGMEYYKAEPFGGQRLPPVNASEEILYNFHSNACQEEILALGMLMRGISLEINIADPAPTIDKPSDDSRDIYREAYEKQVEILDRLGTQVYIQLNIPSAIEGDITVIISPKDMKSVVNKNYSIMLNILKENGSVALNGVERADEKIPVRIIPKNRWFSSDEPLGIITGLGVRSSKVEVVFSLSNKENKSDVIAKDKFIG